MEIDIPNPYLIRLEVIIVTPLAPMKNRSPRKEKNLNSFSSPYKKAAQDSFYLGQQQQPNSFIDNYISLRPLNSILHFLSSVDRSCKVRILIGFACCRLE